MQHGGNNEEDYVYMLDSYIDDIVHNRYRLMTDTKLFKNLSTDNCSSSSNLFETSDNLERFEYYNKDRDLKYVCISKPVIKSLIPNNVEGFYQFKRLFGLFITDTYVNKGLSHDDNAVLINYIHFVLGLSIKTYIEKILLLKIFGLLYFLILLYIFFHIHLINSFVNYLIYLLHHYISFRDQYIYYQNYSVFHSIFFQYQ